jgi:hypothetical protein
LSSAKRRSIVSLVWEILHADERRKLFGIFILMLVGSVLETVSLGLIVPAMGALTNPEYLRKFPTIDKFLGYPTPSQVVAITMGLLVAVYISKSALVVTCSMSIYGSHTNFIRRETLLCWFATRKLARLCCRELLTRHLASLPTRR